MNRIILFSPVGGTDPISLTNCRDGSMLHICRNYNVDKVYLYMSEEIIINHKADNRYIYCLEKLMELKHRFFEYEIIERPSLKNVQEFDFFYKDFRNILVKIFSEMDKTDTLLLNVSSGTPAMKSALLVLKTLGEFPCKLIQVNTPEKAMNESRHKNYDVKVLWELDEDNGDCCENRCMEIHCPTLSALKNQEIIKKQLLTYDYQAALSVAENMESDFSGSYIDLLRMAYFRLLLNFKEVDSILKKYSFDFLPVRESSSRKYFEYALNLDIKLKRREYADFIRATTPLIVDLFEIILRKQYKIDINDYSKITKKGREWDSYKLKGTQVLSVLLDINPNFNYGFIYSFQLRALLNYYSNNPSLKKLIDDLRFIEEKVRNLAAHQIVSIDDDKIRELTGFSGENIMNKIKQAFLYTKMNIKPEFWDSYDQMNKRIINLIDKTKS